MRRQTKRHAQTVAPILGCLCMMANGCGGTLETEEAAARGTGGGAAGLEANGGAARANASGGASPRAGGGGGGTVAPPQDASAGSAAREDAGKDAISDSASGRPPDARADTSPDRATRDAADDSVVLEAGPRPDAAPVDAASSGDVADSGRPGLGVIGHPCAPAGAHACAGTLQNDQLVCQAGFWTAGEECAAGMYCDTTPGLNAGMCRKVASECVGKKPHDVVCTNGNVAICGPDLVTTELVETCSGETPACSGGTCVPCTPNTTPTHCRDFTPQYCTADRTWQDRASGACTAPTPVCVAGSCAVCAPDPTPTRCAGSTPQYCDATGTWRDRAVPCARNSAPVCESGACRQPQTVSVEAGYEYSCARFDNGMLKCWGSNYTGQLGLGDTQYRGITTGGMGSALPVADLGPVVVSAAAPGFDHMCALLDTGQVKCWGSNYTGQLGLGDSFSRADDPGEMGESLPNPDLGTGRTAQAIAAGSGHTCAILDNHQIKCWGENDYGELGLGDMQNRGSYQGQMGDSLPSVDLGAGRTAQAIAAGAAHTCAILDNGQVKCWGWNDSGQLGLGDTANHGDDPGEMGDALPSVDLGAGRTAKRIVAGYAHTCVILDNDQIKCWGQNGEGELGLEDTQNRGDYPGQMGDNLPVVRVGSGSNATELSARGPHTCALLGDARVKCWGYNYAGQLGLGDSVNHGDEPGEMGDGLPSVDLGTGRSAVRLAAGGEHVCVLLDNHRIKCWGQNDYGQLGLGDTSFRGDGPGQMGDQLPEVALW